MRKRFSKLLKWLETHPKAWKIVVATSAILLVGWILFLWYRVDASIVRTDPSADITEAEPVIAFVPSPLTGIPVSEALAERPILAAQIENSLDARPQSGLQDAGVVFEAIAEAGITRFSAYYQESSPKILGPIRSLRPYYIDWLLGFDASVVHVGGSTQAKALVPQLGVKSLDVSGAYYRASDRYAPHNAYSSYDTLRDIMKRLGHYQAPDFTPLKRKDESPLETIKAQTINLDISSSSYNVSYTYNSDCNCYKRNMAGVAHKDRESGKQLSPKVVIALKVPQRVIDSVGHIGMDTIGSGEGWVFQDGNVTKVTWKKAARDKNFTFTSGDKEIGLNPGQTWVMIMPSDAPVSYSP